MDKKRSKARYLNLCRMRFSAIKLILAASILSGCATTAYHKEVKTSATLEAKSFEIGKAKYVSLKDFCRNFDLVWDWDSLGKKITLYREGLRVDMAVGSDLVLINSKKANLYETVKVFNNEVAFPFVLVDKVYAVTLPAVYAPRRTAIGGTYRIKRIVLDPGHGGRDPGAISPEGLREKNIVMEMAKELKGYLERQGIEVILTRSDDRFVSLWRRTHLANMKKADLFISVHVNSSRHEEAKGFELYYLSEKMNDSARALARAENSSLELEGEKLSNTSTALAATVWDLVQTENRSEAIQLSNYIGNSVDKIEWMRNRGIKGALFYVLKGANMPAILVEAGFVSNISESCKLRNPSYRQELVKAIGEGIMDFKDEYERTDGFTQ
ncbi:MAG: N-acetylmuramoyl-L-alanine amidase [Candidatus Omnitrophica bacterium]|nr:N-acetylmuramoyl-L-alanine amidase [Candidatus Omnitrophota bacterium]